MTGWIFLWLLSILALFAVAIYEHVKTTTLSLPVSPTLTILTILLPLLALTNAIYLPHLTSYSTKHPQSQSQSPSSIQKYLPHTLQLLQLLLTTILATLFASDILPDTIRSCLLETKWKSFWTTHDADAIRAIQNTFNCCGFRTTKDMAWPFPQGKGGPVGKGMECVQRYGRSEACKGPWGAALNGGMGTELGVVLGVAVLQALSVWFVGRYGYGGGDGDREEEGGGWVGIVKRLFGLVMGGNHGNRGGGSTGGGASARLLVGGAGHREGSDRVVDVDEDEEEGDDEAGERYYRDGDLEGQGHGHGQRRGGNGYGTTAGGNEWR